LTVSTLTLSMASTLMLLTEQLKTKICADFHTIKNLYVHAKFVPVVATDVDSGTAGSVGGTGTTPVQSIVYAKVNKGWIGHGLAGLRLVKRDRVSMLAYHD